MNATPTIAEPSASSPAPHSRVAADDCVMTSLNFEFLRSKRAELADIGGFAERYALIDITLLFGANSAIRQATKCISIVLRNIQATLRDGVAG